MTAPELPVNRQRLSVLISVGVAAILGVGLLWLAAGEATPRRAPQEPGSRDFVAEWMQLPSMPQVVEAYPAKAKAAAFGEHVVVDLNCVIEDDGTLGLCEVMKESVTGWGFGEAALALTKHFRIRTVAPDGASLVGRTVDVPMRFPILEAPAAERGPRRTIS